MVGYNGWSMSNNAVDCYADNIKPISKWSKGEILELINEYYSVEILELAKKVNLKALKDIFLEYHSWHHTSSKYNKTDFYNFNSDIDSNLKEKLENSMIKVKVKKEPVKSIKALVTYKEWYGTRAHPKCDVIEEIVNYNSNDKMVKTSCGNKRLSSLSIIKYL